MWAHISVRNLSAVIINQVKICERQYTGTNIECKKEGSTAIVPARVSTSFAIGFEHHAAHLDH